MSDIFFIYIKYHHASPYGLFQKLLAEEVFTGVLCGEYRFATFGKPISNLITSPAPCGNENVEVLLIKNRSSPTVR